MKQFASYDPDSYEFIGLEKGSLDPLETKIAGHEVYLVPAHSTAVLPPEIPQGHAARWDMEGQKWDVLEDHRRDPATGREGTAFWLPGDTWQSPARHMTELGPLPAGAILTRPGKSLPIVKEEKEREIRSACDAAIVASLTMPAASPSAIEVSVAAASLAAVDPDGPDTLLALHAARRDELLAAVDAADSVEAVQAVVVDYDV